MRFHVAHFLPLAAFVAIGLASDSSASALIDAEGRFVGAYLGDLPPLVRDVPLRRAEILTTKGFRLVLDPQNGAIRSSFAVYFESADCSGEGWVERRRTGDFDEAPFPGYVFGAGDGTNVDPATVYYVPADAEEGVDDLPFFSKRSLDGSCNVASGLLDTPRYRVLENDPDVTGFDPGQLTPPYGIVLQFELFRDGFEALVLVASSSQQSNFA